MTSLPTDDLELIERYLAGDDRAAEELFVRYYPKVLGLCRRYFPCRDDAEDAAQTVFINILVNKKIFSFRGQSKLWTWLYKITANTCKDAWRKKQTHAHRRVDLMPELAAPDLRENEKILQTSKEESLAKSLQSLPHPYRKAILSFYFKGNSYVETADRMNISKTNVGILLMRAKEKLKYLVGNGRGPSAVPLTDVFIMHFEEICEAV
jgi:RNA polymerase sigma-70 factor, ECF subfamily